MNSIALIAIDSLLGLLFIGSGYFLWKSLRGIIPQTLSVSDEVFMARFEEDAKHNLFWKALFRFYHGEIEYAVFFRRRLGRVLYRAHIMLLRLDNWVFAKYNRIRSTSGAEGDVRDSEKEG